MRQIIIFIVFVCALELCSAYTHFELPITRAEGEEGDEGGEEEEEVCKSAGLICKNCSSLINCIEVEEGKFIEVGVKTCSLDEHETCLINKCSTSPNPQCPVPGLITFQCHNTGVYPDPSNCRIYHMCVEKRHNLDSQVKDLVHTTVKCDDEYGYNPVTTYCDVKLPTGNCETLPLPACETLGQMGGVPGTSIFYVCTEEEDDETLVADLFMCPAGSKFTDGSCE